jgi:2,3-bisphosphoglycerate-independent phosphoglycerate mutase
VISAEIVRGLTVRNDARIVLLVLDGLGGLPDAKTGKTELEAAHTPYMDELARRGICGMADPIGRGITPGSGPAHLSLFGYDPFKYQIGRGALAALGVGFELGPNDVAARINFATIDQKGIVTDRRAGRIPTERNQQLCAKLRKIKIPGVELFIEPVKEHRAVVVFRAEGLSDQLTDSDPQNVGLSPLDVVPISAEAAKSAEIANNFISQARGLLKDERPANMVLLRGFAKYPDVLSMSEVYGLNSAAIAAYPMYKGIARLVGMDLLSSGDRIADEFNTLADNFAKYDFFYLHIKKTDSTGEDGNFPGKVKIIEEVDSCIPRLTGLNPDVVVITGDHSTPSLLKAHSWHPVPVLLLSKWCRPDRVEEFSESRCLSGGLGRFPATEIMALALANALKLKKFGA